MGLFQAGCAQPAPQRGWAGCNGGRCRGVLHRTNISVADVADPQFQQWLGELMSSLTDVSGAGAYTAEDFALFGYSVGDGGQLLESDLLNNMAGIQTRWSDPL